MLRLFRDRLLAAVAALVLAVAVTGAVGALGRVGEPFPGFLVLGNRVIASVGLATWPATAGGEVFQAEVVAAADRPIHTPADLAELVRSVPVGTPIEYRLRHGAEQRSLEAATRRFGVADFLLLYGMYLVNGLALGAAGLVALSLRRRNPAAGAAAPALLLGSLWTLSALDLYGPYHLFPLHAACEALLFPAALHMALGFPRPLPQLARRPWLLAVPYGIGLVLAIVYLIGLDRPSTYSGTHLLAVSAFGAALLALVVAEIERFRRAATLEVRERIRILAMGALLAFGLPICLMLAELLTGGRSPANALALTGWIFPASVAYAVAGDELVRAGS